MKKTITDYKTEKILYKDTLTMRFLYNSFLGRIFLYILVRPSISKVFGVFLNSHISRFLIEPFIKRNNMNMQEYDTVKYNSFNDFFTRKIKNEHRPFSNNVHDVSAPCDGKLTAYTITSDSSFFIKNSFYTLTDLLQNSNLSKEFTNGVCLIFRLTPDDYHRYAYIDDGKILLHKKIKGILHTVRPISQHRYNVFVQNTREYMVMQTTNFGKVIQMEVGALLVGRITNHNIDSTCTRGVEKGMFEFGGSTIVMLFQNNAITLDDKIYINTQQHRETIVKMGCTIARKTINGEDEVR